MSRNSAVKLFLIIVFLAIFHGCDNGSRYIKMSIITMPQKTEYISGKDQVLDFDGGVIKLETLDGREDIISLQAYTYQNREIKKVSDIGMYISSDINFDLPGEYTVTIWQTNSLFCQYSVHVQLNTNTGEG